MNPKFEDPRAMKEIERLVGELRFWKDHAQTWEAIGMNSLLAIQQLKARLKVSKEVA